jgi:hypothetical protein
MGANQQHLPDEASEFSDSMPALCAPISSLEDYFLVNEDISGPLIFNQMKS